MANFCHDMDSRRAKTGGGCWPTFKMPLNLPHQLIFHCILIVIYLTSTNGCFRRQVKANDDDDDASMATDHLTSTTTTTHHRMECRLEEAAYAGCLNGGKCFIIELQKDLRHIQCSCTSEWQGERCQILYIDPDHWSIEEAKEQAKKMAIVLAFGITVSCLLLILIAFTVVYMRRRYKHAEEKRRKKEEEKRRHDELQTEKTTSLSQQQRTVVIPISSV